MTSPKQLLDSHGISPKKSLGQNYIHDPNTLDKIVEVSHVTPDDHVLEIGPGTGALSIRLAAVAKHLTLIETDQRMQPILEKELQDFENISFYWQDFLEVDLDAMVGAEPYIVVANLPYYITSAIIRRLLEADNPPRHMTLTIQKEVAERIVADPGDMSLLSVSVQFYGDVSIEMKLSPAVFWPRPSVSSAVIRINFYEDSPYQVEDVDRFFKIVRAGFGQKRKQLRNSLSKGLALSSDEITQLLEKAEVDPRRRPEKLEVADWVRIYHAMETH